MSFLLVMMIFNVSMRTHHKIPQTYIGKVVDISNQYYTVKLKDQKILLYTQKTLSYGDSIKFKGKYEAIFTPASKSSFSFQKYMNRQNIRYRISDKQPEVLSSKFSIRSALHKRILKHSDSQYLSKQILNINSHELDSDVSTFLLSSGVLIRSLIYATLTILNKFFEEKAIYLLELGLYIFLLIIFKQYSFTLYLMIRALLRKTNLKALDKISLSGLLILIINPSYVFSLSFMITTLFAYSSFIKITKSRLIQTYVILIPVQLIMFYQCNLIEMLFYPYIKLINCVAYVLAYFDVFFKSSLSLSFLKTFMIKPFSMVITGHMSLLLLCAWIVVGLKMLQSFKWRYLIMLTCILFLNQHQLTFNPFLIYTQLYIGQGDCALIKYPFKRDVFILDTGSKFNWSKLQSHLNYYGIRDINKLLITHPDEDHNGNLENLYNHYNVKELIEEKGEYSFYGLKLFADNYESDNDNDESLITYFTINNYTYLTLGDASKHVEERFLNDHEGLVYNIVKLGHHGSDTSSSEKLLSHPNINLVLNSSGYKNMYKHPHPLVLKRIFKHQLPYLDTQQYGDIEIKHLFHYDFISLAP